jgi:hypothetical protein
MLPDHLSSGNQKRSGAILRSGPVRLRQRHGLIRQGQAHIVSTALRLRVCSRSFVADRAGRTDPQPASISPTINISIVFICPFLVDNGRIIYRPATRNDSSAIL